MFKLLVYKTEFSETTFAVVILAICIKYKNLIIFQNLYYEMFENIVFNNIVDHYFICFKHFGKSSPSIHQNLRYSRNHVIFFLNKYII